MALVETDLFEEKKPKAVLVALSEGAEESVVEASLAELEALLETAGGECAFTVVQNLDRPNTKTYIGSGKAKEIAEAVAARGDIDLVIFDNELSPAQLNNLEDIIGVRIIDRTMLILDIFALHATTGEGKLQVEIACLRYTAPRLTGKGNELSRLGGGIGTRGPGESKLESDRRHLKRRIAALEEELAEMQRTRDTKRAARDKKGLKNAAIVGYTNSGKSTLLNYLTGAGILAENKLFATLDPTTRLLTTGDGTEILITDTVGFIDRLPHHLVRAFRSTLDELKYADMIVSVTDASETDTERCRKRLVTDKLVEELCGGDKPVIQLYNKSDIAVEREQIPADAIEISAKYGTGIDNFIKKLEEIANSGMKRVRFFFDHASQGEVSNLYRFATVLETEYTPDGVFVTADCEAKEIGKYNRFIVQ